MQRLEHCPACAGVRIHVAAQADSDARARYLDWSARKYGGLLDSWVDAEGLIVLACKDCGHHWYRDQPTPEQLSAMYAAGKPLRDSATPSREPTPAMRSEMDRLHRLAGGGAPSLLDYGSGFGRWARAAVSAGFRVHAYEPSAVRGGEPDAPFALVHHLEALQGMTFDVIQLEQVLEHVPDPVAVMRDLRRFCHDHTLVRVTVPNLRRCDEGRHIWREWPFNGKRAHVMAPYEHLHGFTPDSLLQVAQRAGYASVGMGRLLLLYPVSTLRALSRHLLPSLGQTFLILRPLGA